MKWSLLALQLPHPGPHFYCFRSGPYIFFKYARHNHLRCPMKHLSKHSLIKHTCSWRVNLLYYENWTDKRKYFYVGLKLEQKKVLHRRYFLVNFAKSVRTQFLQNTSRWNKKKFSRLNKLWFVVQRDKNKLRYTLEN